MAGMCYGFTGETETSVPVEPISKSARRRRMEIHQFNFVPADAAVPPLENGGKRRKVEEGVLTSPPPPQRKCGKAVETGSRVIENEVEIGANKESEVDKCLNPTPSSAKDKALSAKTEAEVVKEDQEFPKFGMTSICGMRRDMEDAVAVYPSFCSGFHFFGVYDGHGCSHVAMKCRDRMHEIVKNEVENREGSWENMMRRSFLRMDKEVTEWSNNNGAGNSSSNCRCELQTPQCDAVGSTAVVAVVTPDKIVVSNCGDSRAVLCRNGVAIPLSSDHKPDRPDELARIQEAGGRVIYWDGPRVLGVLAMSRAIGDNYLKPYVISDPEVTVTERTAGDECLILASDGLWDVVSIDTACSVARMCIQAQKPPSPPQSPGSEVNVSSAGESSHKACSDASILLTRLALARHSTDNVSVVVVDLRREL